MLGWNADRCRNNDPGVPPFATVAGESDDLFAVKNPLDRALTMRNSTGAPMFCFHHWQTGPASVWSVLLFEYTLPPPEMARHRNTRRTPAPESPFRLLRKGWADNGLNPSSF